jgi:RimJ/RimL family protein N-acetyltransferase
MRGRDTQIRRSVAEGLRVGAVVIPSVRLDLVLMTPEEVIASVEALPPADRAEVSPAWLARVRGTAPGDAWALGFRVVERDGGAVVGSCGFKGPPDSDGVVELAYAIDPGRRGRGYATEAAAALAAFALADGRVRLVRAHTKSDNTASARVLTKCGFQRIGEVIDPEDGPVCRWERAPGAG